MSSLERQCPPESRRTTLCFIKSRDEVALSRSAILQSFPGIPVSQSGSSVLLRSLQSRRLSYKDRRPWLRAFFLSLLLQNFFWTNAIDPSDIFATGVSIQILRFYSACPFSVFSFPLSIKFVIPCLHQSKSWVAVGIRPHWLGAIASGCGGLDKTSSKGVHCVVRWTGVLYA